jgi:predicted permease
MLVEEPVMIQDLRYAVRVLLQGKLWSAIVVVSLALGIGANTALFSATNGLVLRKLSVEDPDSLVRLRHVGRHQMATDTSEYGYIAREGGTQAGSTFSYPMYQQLRKDNQTMSDLAAVAPFGSVNVVVDGNAEIATAVIASGNYHQMLGVKALVGRTLLPADDSAGAPPVTVISPGFWSRRFGSDRAVLGKVIQANNTAVTIVGVTVREFTGVQQVVADAVDLAFPLALDPLLTPAQGAAGISRMSQPTSLWLQLIGRLKPGATAAQVEGNLGGVFQQTAREGMASYLASLPEAERNNTRNRSRTEVSRLWVSSGARGIYDIGAAALRSTVIISVVVALILLLVCANVANLLLSRAAVRQREISLRLSIGASRFRLIRQLLTESVLLALTGGALGLAVAYWGKRLLPGTTGQAPLDWRVMLFAAGVALLTGIIFGIAPALRVTGVSVNDVLKDSGRSVTGSRTLLSKSLLVLQVAISLVLLIGAGLFLRTVDNLRRVDVGFNPHNLVIFRINPALNRYDQPRIVSLHEQLQQRLATIPGVRSVSLSNPPMLSGGVNTTDFVAQGRPYTTGGQYNINRVRISPGFFETMEFAVLRGRGFNERDNTLTAPKVAIVNEAAVAKYLGGIEPLGQRFGSSPETSGQLEIVGVVRDIKYNDLREPPPPTMYVPYAQGPIGSMAYEIRTAADPAAVMGSIRDAVRQVDSNVPVMGLTTQIDSIAARYAAERIFAQAYALFGGLALLVASIGLFGLMSYNVTRRTTEIGIRMALGAQQRSVLQMVLSESLVLVAIGVVIGVGAAIGGGRFIASLLFGLEPTDLRTTAMAVLLMASVAAFAGYLPARRASRLDPMVALRHD